MAGRLTEPKIITDYNQRMVCILPPGFYFDDTRWEQIWVRYEEKGETLTSIDLLQMYPDEEVLKNMVPDEQALSEMVPAGINRAIDKRS
jgi:hypothetical protein